MPLEIGFCPNGSLLRISYLPLALAQAKIGAARLGVWSVPSGKQVLDRPNQEGLWGAAFSPDSRLLACLAPDGSLTFLDIASDTEVLSLPFPGPVFNPEGSIRTLVFTPDGSSLATIIPSANPREGSSAIQFLDLAGLRRRLAEMGLDW
jgi:WD40 repeat protein